MTDLSTLLLEWYAHNGRDLPWRFKGGKHPNPYIVLISEFMLQQTTVKTVLSYFAGFIERFPDIQSLAAASIDEVYQQWQGLGYYSRARSLHATAQTIVNQYAGYFPDTRSEVLQLKGIGTYTAASFLSLAYNQPETVIDGNVMRIICRLYRFTEPLSDIQDKIRTHAEKLTCPKHPADYASAIMDLGATICTPKKPQCLLCPWQKHCLSANTPDVETIPLRKKLAKQEKTGYVYLIRNRKNEIFIRKRTEKGLLSGLYEFPWSDTTPLFPNAPNTHQEIHHTFTHFKLTLHIHTLQAEEMAISGHFVSTEMLKNYALSTLMKKVANKISEL